MSRKQVELILSPTQKGQREALRQRGQFWTPAWIADVMTYYVLEGNDSLFDPAVGAGAFFASAKRQSQGKTVSFRGTESDPLTLVEAHANGLTDEELAGVEIRDFVLSPPHGLHKAIVANPPYIRHHRLPREQKEILQAYSKARISKKLDGRVGYHYYFLLRILELLEREGRLAIIVPVDICEGISASHLWQWLTKHYKLEAVLTFTSQATPFPKVDTNPIVFFIRNIAPTTTFAWARCEIPETDSLLQWVKSDFVASSEAVTVQQRDLEEALRTGLSRPAQSQRSHSGAMLSYYAKVMRGIATGANDYFFLTQAEADSKQIPVAYLKRAIGRTRDIQDVELTEDCLATLEKKGRPTYLLSLTGQDRDTLPLPLQVYLQVGEGKGLPNRALISQRKPWYRMEQREVPPLLFAYLGRRNIRFIRNNVGVVPLTSFLCVYPHENDEKSVRRLWQALNDPRTLANLGLVSKSYGGGSQKVEPRALERLIIPYEVIIEYGLKSVIKIEQLAFLPI